MFMEKAHGQDPVALGLTHSTAEGCNEQSVRIFFEKPCMDAATLFHVVAHELQHVIHIVEGDFYRWKSEWNEAAALAYSDYLACKWNVAYNKVFTGDRKGILYCLDAETGKSIWKMETGSTISSPIIVADKKVAFGTDDGTLYLVKAESGKICESLDFDSGITGLALSDGKLFIGQHNGRVSCFEGSTSKNLIPAVFILILSVVLVFTSVWYQRKS